MKEVRGLIGMLLVGCACVALSGCFESSTQTSAGRKIEYRVAATESAAPPDAIQALINAQAKEGWEFVQMETFMRDYTTRIVFKRSQ